MGALAHTHLPITEVIFREIFVSDHVFEHVHQSINIPLLMCSSKKVGHGAGVTFVGAGLFRHEAETRVVEEPHVREWVPL